MSMRGPGVSATCDVCATTRRADAATLARDERISHSWSGRYNPFLWTSSVGQWHGEKIMTPEQIAELRQKYYNATIASLKLVNEDLMIARIRPDFKVPVHKPGQYSTLGLGQWEPRHPGA